MNKAGAVIVTHNSEAEIGPCLDAALGRFDEIVVVDNASQDGTRDAVSKRPAVRGIFNSCNRGFAAAVNQGMSGLNTPFVLLLNPDAVLLTGIEPLLDACAPPAVAAAGGKLVDGRGNPQTGFCVRRFPTPSSLTLEILGINRLWPGNPVNRRYRCLDFDHEAAAEVEQPAGAFLMVRRDAWETLGGFDEQFHPLWFEDVDFLKRARDRSYRVVYSPDAVARHEGGHSVRKIPGESREVYWYASLLRYSSKHFRPHERRMVQGMLLLATMLRMVAGFLMERTFRPFRIYGKVMRLTFHWRSPRRGTRQGAGLSAAV